MSKTKVDPITRAAIDWILRLESGHACPSERQVFKAWLAENPEHMAAWQRVAGLLKNPLADLQSVDRRSPGQLQAARKALLETTSPSRKKTLQGGVLLLLLGLGAAGVVDRVTPLAGFMADQHTGTGERKTIELADGSRLTLNARSAVDTPAELCRHLSLDSGSMTRMLDRLEQKNLLIRQRSEADRRQVRLVLTDDGLALADELPIIGTNAMNQLAGEISPQELQTLEDILKKILLAAGDPITIMRLGEK